MWYDAGKRARSGSESSLGLLRGEHKALARQLDGGRHHALEIEAAVFSLRIHQAGDRARRGDGAVAENARVGNHVAACVEIHVLGGGQRSFFAVVEKDGFAGVVADEHEAAAAEVACGGMDHGESKTRGHRGVNGVAALLKNAKTRIGSQMMHAHHHAVPRAHRLLAAIRQRCGCWLLGEERRLRRRRT